MIKGLEILDDLYRETGKIEEWRADSAREILLRLGRKRFGEPSAETVQALNAVSSVEILQRMAERLLDVENWDDLLASE